MRADDTQLKHLKHLDEIIAREGADELIKSILRAYINEPDMELELKVGGLDAWLSWLSKFKADEFARNKEKIFHALSNLTVDGTVESKAACRCVAYLLKMSMGHNIVVPTAAETAQVSMFQTLTAEILNLENLGEPAIAKEYIKILLKAYINRLDKSYDAEHLTSFLNGRDSRGRSLLTLLLIYTNSRTVDSCLSFARKVDLLYIEDFYHIQTELMLEPELNKIGLTGSLNSYIDSMRQLLLESDGSALEFIVRNLESNKIASIYGARKMGIIVYLELVSSLNKYSLYFSRVINLLDVAVDSYQYPGCASHAILIIKDKLNHIDLLYPGEKDTLYKIIANLASILALIPINDGELFRALFACITALPADDERVQALIGLMAPWQGAKYLAADDLGNFVFKILSFYLGNERVLAATMFAKFLEKDEAGKDFYDYLAKNARPDTVADVVMSLLENNCHHMTAYEKLSKSNHKKAVFNLMTHMAPAIALSILKQALDPSTLYGKYFYIRNGLAKPSITSGTLKLIHEAVLRLEGGEVVTSPAAVNVEDDSVAELLERIGSAMHAFAPAPTTVALFRGGDAEEAKRAECRAVMPELPAASSAGSRGGRFGGLFATTHHAASRTETNAPVSSSKSIQAGRSPEFDALFPL